MNAAQEWVLLPRRIEMGKFGDWAKKNLCETDAVVIETTTNVWDLYDIVQPLVGHAVVAPAGAIRQIAEARVKTDKEDVKRLIRLLIADILPEVWVPPQPVRELRGLISYRQRLVKTGAVFRNRLQSLLHSHNLVLPEEGLLSQEWWARQEKISPLEKLQIGQEIALLEQIEKHKAEVDQELGKQSLGETWGRDAVRLMQLPGIGVVIAMTVLSAIGDIRRFESPKKLVGYAGFGAGVEDSGQKHRDKGITKSGRKELRWALVEAAWQAIRANARLRAQYDELCQRKLPNQAIVAIARKLLVTLWYLLSKQESYDRASDEDLAYKMLTWAWHMDQTALNGLTNQQFTKSGLLQLGRGEQLTRIVKGGVPRRIAPKEAVLALKPDLRSPL